MKFLICISIHLCIVLTVLCTILPCVQVFLLKWMVSVGSSVMLICEWFYWLSCFENVCGMSFTFLEHTSFSAERGAQRARLVALWRWQQELLHCALTKHSSPLFYRADIWNLNWQKDTYIEICKISHPRSQGRKEMQYSLYFQGH